MEPVAWEGWWEESLVKVANESIQNPTALTVLMTGRSEANYSELIKKMVAAKGLDFDLVVLKPHVKPDGSRSTNTAEYKTAFFQDALMTYTNADLFIWEDRKRQAEKFNTFLHEFAGQLDNLQDMAPRKAFDYDVHLVNAATCGSGAPDNEIDQITNVINDHNNAIAYGKASRGAVPYKYQSNRLFTGYILPPVESDKLKKLIRLPVDRDIEDVRILADNIMVSFHPPAQHIVDKAGGWGSWHRWRVIRQGSYNDTIWAVQVTPSDPTYRHVVNTKYPYVILCHTPRTKPTEAARQISNWQDLPLDAQIEFNTKFEDRAVLRIVADASSIGGPPDAKRTKYENGGELIYVIASISVSKLTDILGYRTSSGPGQRHMRDARQPQSSADDTDGESERISGQQRSNQHRSNQHRVGSAYQRINHSGGRNRGRGGGSMRGRGRSSGRGGSTDRSGQYRSLDDAGRAAANAQSSEMQY